MDVEATSASDKAHWAWARTGALALFLVTAVLLITSLNAARSNEGSADLRFTTEAAQTRQL